MLLIGTPVKVSDDVQDAQYTQDLNLRGAQGHVQYVRLGEGNEFPFEVLFNIKEDDGDYVVLGFDLTEIEVLADDICYCHLLRGDQAETSCCQVCADLVIAKYSKED